MLRRSIMCSCYLISQNLSPLKKGDKFVCKKLLQRNIIKKKKYSLKAT